MDIKAKLFEQKDYFIIASFVIAILEIFDFFPDGLPIVGDWTTYLYLGVIGFSAYLYYTQHFGKGYGPSVKTHQRTVPSRNLSRPQRAKPQEPSVFDEFNK